MSEFNMAEKEHKKAFADAVAHMRQWDSAPVAKLPPPPKLAPVKPPPNRRWHHKKPAKADSRLDKRTVAKLYGVSLARIDRWVAEGKFPKPQDCSDGRQYWEKAQVLRRGRPLIATP